MSGTPTKLRIDQVEKATLALLRKVMPAVYGQVHGAKVDIDSLGDKDFNEQGQLVLRPPSIRVRFAEATYNNLRDNQRLSYQAGLKFELLCYESSLRSAADQRRQTLILVADVLDQIAGARLALDDGADTEPVTMLGVSLVTDQNVVYDQLFAVSILIGGIVQFSGANARFGA